jgi:hypothetical protein
MALDGKQDEEEPLNEKQDEQGAGSHTEGPRGDRDHRVDIPGPCDALAAEVRALKAQVEEERALVRQMITSRSEKKFTIQGKSLERLREENQADGKRLENISAFERVKNRLWIKQNTVFNELVEDGERSLNLITQRVDRREKRVEDLTNQVFNLVGFFSVFQGVILTAVTQLSTSVTTQLGAPQVQARPLCGKVWVPVVLSALAAVVSVVAVLLKFKHLSTLDRSINDEKHHQSVRGFSHATYLQSFVGAVSISNLI